MCHLVSHAGFKRAHQALFEASGKTMRREGTEHDGGHTREGTEGKNEFDHEPIVTAALHRAGEGQFEFLERVLFQLADSLS